MLHPDMPLLTDPEGDAVDARLSPVIDAHVHVFPDPLFASQRAWFDAHAWPLRYRPDARGVVDFLLARGVQQVVALQFAHRPGMARELNRFMVELCAAVGPRVSGLATVFPGEDHAGDILAEAFAGGLHGVKLHAHVQCFDMNSDDMEPIYRACIDAGKPLLMHVGREPSSDAYRCDPHLLCRVDKLERVLVEHPELRVCVPHLGFDETEAYVALLERHDNLWLDTTMALAGYLPGPELPPLTTLRADRLLYGSDFPNIPYAWDRELNILAGLKLPPPVLRGLLADNARVLYGLGACREKTTKRGGADRSESDERNE